MDNATTYKKSSSKTFEAFELTWDTKYFNLCSAKAVLKDNVPSEERDQLIDFSKNFEFVTITNSGNKPQNNSWIGKETNAFLTDMNIQFIKDISTKTLKNDSIAEIKEGYPNNKSVLDIARNSFRYSRFFNDPLLPVEKARGIYVAWTEGAFNKRGRFFAVTKRAGTISGFLLFSINAEESNATIELIAVDEAFKGLNIGKSLIAGMETFLYSKGIAIVMVGTQIENVAAARFYANCGFTYSSCSAVYHFWPQINY